MQSLTFFLALSWWRRQSLLILALTEGQIREKERGTCIRVPPSPNHHTSNILEIQSPASCFTNMKTTVFLFYFCLCLTRGLCVPVYAGHEKDQPLVL